MLKRRLFLAGLMGATGLGAAGLTFRVHRTPRRHPFLTQTHLQSLLDLAATPKKVLFVGNSFTVGHNIPAQIAAAALNEDVPVQVATAAANGARLIETLRIPEFRDVLQAKWDVVVLQDYSNTVLRGTDRWASAFAMRQIVRMAGAQTALLFPTWAMIDGHPIYRDGGLLSVTPENRTDFAARITAFYAELADQEGWTRAPVTEALHDGVHLLTARDGHHLNPQGAAKVSAVLWESLRELIQST